MAVWQRNLYVSWVAQMLALVGFSASIPFIPLFLVKDLGVKTEDAGLISGLMFTISSLAMAFLAPVWGSLADRFGRKSMVLRAMIGGTILVGLMFFIHDVWLLFVLRIFQGALTGTVPANIALIAAMTPPKRLGYALGLIQTAVFVGASVGPLVGGFFADVTNYRTTFLITSAALGLAAVLVAFFVHEEFTPVVKDKTTHQENLWERIANNLRNSQTATMLLIIFLVQFSGSVIAPLLALFIQQLNGKPDGAATLAGLELAATGIAAAISAVFFGRLSDRIGHRKILIFASIGAAVFYIPQFLVGDFVQLLVLRILSGLFVGGLMPSANALLSSSVPANRRGTIFGVSSMFSSFGFASGPFIGATLGTFFTIRPLFIIVGLTLFTITFCLLNFVKNPVTEEQSEEGESTSETRRHGEELRAKG